MLRRESLSRNVRHGFLLAALCNLVLSPLWLNIFSNDSKVVAVNYTILIIAGFLLSSERRKQHFGLILGIVAVIMIWVEGLNVGGGLGWTVARSLITLCFIIFLCAILMREILDADEVDIYLILDAIAGFLFLGLLGGIMFELLDILLPGSFITEIELTGYIYYYFSFITITSVGYGDVIPSTSSAHSLSLLFGILGQFYMAIVVAVFVGKYLSERNSKNIS